MKGDTHDNASQRGLINLNAPEPLGRRTAEDYSQLTLTSLSSRTPNSDQRSRFGPRVEVAWRT
jgi:hypothetical protein